MLIKPEREAMRQPKGKEYSLERELCEQRPGGSQGFQDRMEWEAVAS